MRKFAEPDPRISRARILRREMTEAEKRLWQYLRRPPLKEHHFRRQATIGIYFCDFASHRLKIAIELDGGQHADNAADANRTAYLVGQHYRVIRFWNNDVLHNITGVLLAIEEVIASYLPPTPTPDPSPPQAGGGE